MEKYPLISRGVVTLSLIGGLAGVLSACDATPLPVNSANGVYSQITSVTHSSSGFQLTVVLINADTGSIAYSSYCPGTLQVHRDDQWQLTDGSAICRGTAKVLSVGDSIAFTEDFAGASGDAIRNGSHWQYFNGSAGGDAVSFVVVVR